MVTKDWGLFRLPPYKLQYCTAVQPQAIPLQAIPLQRINKRQRTFKCVARRHASKQTAQIQPLRDLNQIYHFIHLKRLSMAYVLGQTRNLTGLDRNVG